MARLARLEIPGGWYHIINRGHQRGERVAKRLNVQC
jgi:hypothetical protein